MSIDLRNMERLKRIFTVFGLAGVLLLAACSKQAGDAPGPEPGSEPAIRWDPASPTVGQAVTFSLDGDVSSLRSVLWMFGDGKTASAQPAETVEHAYAAAGEYVVKAVVTPLSGAMRELSRTIAVNDTQAGMVVTTQG